jgi:hypothetical protein
VGRYGGRRDRLALGDEDTARGYVCEKICVCVGLVEEAFVVEEREVIDDWGGLVAVEEEGRRRFGSGRMGRVGISEAGMTYSAGSWWSCVCAWWWGATAAGTAAAVEVMLTLSDFKSAIELTSFSPPSFEQIDRGKGDTNVGRFCR